LILANMKTPLPGPTAAGLLDKAPSDLKLLRPFTAHSYV
jgi:hypothetical protein